MCGILDISWALLYVISNQRPLGVGVSQALELALLGSDHWIFAEKKAMVALQESMWGFMVGFFFFFGGGFLYLVVLREKWKRGNQWKSYSLWAEMFCRDVFFGGFLYLVVLQDSADKDELIRLLKDGEVVMPGRSHFSYK